MMRFAWVVMLLIVGFSSAAVAQTRVQAEAPVRSNETPEAVEAPSDDGGDTPTARDDDEDEDEGEESEESNTRHSGTDEFDWDALELDGYSATERCRGCSTST